MKFHHKKEVSLEETPILLRLERRHTLAGGREPDPERSLSRANSVGSFTGLGTPVGVPPPIHKCRSEDKRSVLSRASTIVITENELASSSLYNNKKAQMQMEAAKEAPTQVSSPQPNATKMDVPILSVRPTPRPKPLEPLKSHKKSRSTCCSYATIALFICLASVGILMAIGGIIYMELFSTYVSSNKNSLLREGARDDALGEAEGRLLDSLYEESRLEPDQKKETDQISGLDVEINLDGASSFLVKLGGDASSDEKPSESEVSDEENPNLDLSFRGLLNKAFLEIPKELSKMLTPPPSLEQIEKQVDEGSVVVDPTQDRLGKKNREPEVMKGGDTDVRSSISDSNKSSVTYVEVENPQDSDEDDLFRNDSVNDLKRQEKEELEDGANGKRIPISDVIKESSVSYVVSNQDSDHHQEMKADDQQVKEIFVPIGHAEDHAKENIDSPNGSSTELTDPSFQEPPIAIDKSNTGDDNNSSSENNHVEDFSNDFVPKSPVTEVKPEKDSKAVPFEFFRRLGFDRDTIISNPLLTVDDMNIKFSINEALKVLRNLENNFAAPREKSKPKVRSPVKNYDVGKERREYLLKLRRNMLHLRNI